MVRRARLARLPVAHLHVGLGGDETALRIPIGRFDPVFKAHDLRAKIPGGLIEFFVSSPSKTITFAGAAQRTQLNRLTELLSNTGFAPRILPSAWLVLDDRRAGSVQPWNRQVGFGVAEKPID